MEIRSQRQGGQSGTIEESNNVTDLLIMHPDSSRSVGATAERTLI